MKDGIEQLASVGSSWFKAGATRFYFDNLEEVYGLKINSDKTTGRVLSISLDGEEIQKADGFTLMGKLALGKIWFCTETCTFNHSGLDPVMANHLIEIISKKIVEVSNHG